MSIGNRIKAARKSKGWTQAQLAEKSGVATITISQYETGKRQPRTAILEAIADVLEVPFFYLFSGVETNTNEAGFSEARKSYDLEKRLDVLKGGVLSYLEARYGKKELQVETRRIDGVTANVTIYIFQGEDTIAIREKDLNAMLYTIDSLIVSMMLSLGWIVGVHPITMDMIRSQEYYSRAQVVDARYFDEESNRYKQEDEEE